MHTYKHAFLMTSKSLAGVHLLVKGGLHTKLSCRGYLLIFHGMWMLQSAGTDSTVNLWLASINHDELTTERSSYYLKMLLYYIYFRTTFYSSMLTLADKPIHLPDGLIHCLIRTVIMKTAFMVRA